MKHILQTIIHSSRCKLQHEWLCVRACVRVQSYDLLLWCCFWSWWHSRNLSHSVVQDVICPSYLTIQSLTAVYNSPHGWPEADTRSETGSSFWFFLSQSKQILSSSSSAAWGRIEDLPKPIEFPILRPRTTTTMLLRRIRSSGTRDNQWINISRYQWVFSSMAYDVGDENCLCCCCYSVFHLLPVPREYSGYHGQGS